MMTGSIARLTAATLTAVLLGAMAVPSVAAHRSDLTTAREATARFHDVSKAIRAGYARPDAPAPLHECISSLDGTSAMGYHFINGSLLDTTLDPSQPEVLVYAPDRHGRLHLVALEYVVFQTPWIAEHGSAMPRLFHQDYMATGEPNRYEIPAFFSLHVWLWKDNPSGLFAPFNPRVSCDPGDDHGRGHGRGRDDSDRAAGLRPAAAVFQCDVPRRTTRVATGRT
jgi:hypothetical protein